MPSVLHIVTTGNFAGVERYVCDVATETASRGWDTTVVGGASERMAEVLRGDVRWLPGASPAASLRSLARIGKLDVCHAHMTIAEAVAVASRPFHRAPIVATRHFAAPRGSSRAGRFLAPWIEGHLARQIAVSNFVAERLERPPDTVIRSGVPRSPLLWRPESHVVLVLQRLESEKDTFTALRAWQASRLADDGWSLRIVGSGSERSKLGSLVASAEIPGVTFKEWTQSVSDELASAGVFLASAPAEPFGLAVVEAMAAGVPVVACAAGGHLETIGLLPNAATFPPGDIARAGAALRSLLPEHAREAASRGGRRLVEESFTIARHVDELLCEYEAVLLAIDLVGPKAEASPRSSGS